MTNEQIEPTHPRLVIGAPQGRSGKTTATLGLAAALAARGVAVQPFKKGPDFIDPSWLTAAAGLPCRALDPFFMPSRAALREAFLKPHRETPRPDSGPGKESRGELSLIEGNHGLFDSSAAAEDDTEGAGSTADLARALESPLLLVLNAARTGRSAAAIVLGCLRFERDTPIAGVILNRVAGPRHEDKLRQAIERHCGIPVLGALPADPALVVPDRHLGLVPASEQDRSRAVIDACGAAFERHCSVDAILALARSAASPGWMAESSREDSFAYPSSAAVRIGVFRDRAFTFYYHENFEALVEAGAELVFIDAFREVELPVVDALYIGGGFPEVFMEELSANLRLLASVRRAAEQGLPIYAECGGLMYLARGIRWGERHAKMAGVLPVEVEMTDRPQGHGYVAARVVRVNPFFAPGDELRGHEFHNSRIVGEIDAAPAYRLSRGRGMGNSSDGLVYGSVLAAYTHLHAAGAPRWAAGMVARAAGKPLE